MSKYKKYGVSISETYFKRSRPNEPPIRYVAQGYRSSGKVTDAQIKKDPALKNHPQLEKAMMQHEMNEIKLRAKGIPVNKAHKIAMSKESKLIRGKSLSKLWKELNK